MPRAKDECSYTSTPQYAFMAWCSVKKKHRDYFTLLYPKNHVSHGTDEKCMKNSYRKT
jgi:hypothetical protein